MDYRLIPVVFRFPASLVPAARCVSVVATFNGWNPRAHPMTKNPGGEWRTTVFLPPGQVLYCIWVDGVNWLDPHDDGRVPNGWGSEYSVRCVRSDEERWQPRDPPLPGASSRSVPQEAVLK